MQEVAVGEIAAQVVEVISYHPASVIEDWPSPAIDFLQDGDIKCEMCVHWPQVKEQQLIKG